MPIIAKTKQNTNHNIMKKTSLLKVIAIFAFVFAMGFFANAQTSFSCSSRSTCLLDENNDIVDCTDKTESSLFKFNEELTMVTHTTESNKTVYYIHNSEYDEEDNSFTFEVTSENGNNYVFFVFPDDKQIAVYFIDEDNDSWVIVFNVKAIF